MRNLASFSALLVALVLVSYGLYLQEPIYVQAGIAFATLYLATEFRHFYEDWREFHKG